ncbi:Glycosyltransferase involved in cell wall bisynthesis [Paraburkholderia fungorum]|uniref:Glycosyltransferase involved in cell wall bisynthesis n=1 Tax=Paraburkholderia fungorum TaxID=134537 RepID=A0A1H0ZTR7_9BURK|nr:Glycosyltransferase involved in cell wall bisynthesis [Paraburkholderia fungorum]
MQRCRVLVINDYAKMGGAEVVYQQSADLLATLPNVDVERFDDLRYSIGKTKWERSWNLNAARALEEAILEFRPHRIMLHNYHNALSPSVLSVIARYKRKLGYRAYHTCHDYHLVYYNPALQYFDNGRPVIFPIEALRTRASYLRRPTPKGHVHDLLTKVYWHALRAAYQPARVFDKILCPSAFMEEALHRSGINNTALVLNPSSVPLALPPLTAYGKESFNIAFVGRISQEKGLAQFIELADGENFERIDSIGVYGDGPDRAAIEQRFASLIQRGKLIFFGSLPQEKLFPEMRRFADAVVVPSVGAENAPLVIIEAAMLGMPALVHDGGSMAVTADSVGNKIKFLSKPESLRSALDQLAMHLAEPQRKYELGEYLPERYVQRLAEIMHIGEDATPSVRHGSMNQFADKLSAAQ